MIKTGQQLRVTELDFDEIKKNLVDYFKNSETGFTDWDFEGSNLNTFIDILAYNTHYNAMLAHMAVNESFIDSAQLRSSVVSAAKLLGYVPRSRSASRIECDSVNVAANPNIQTPTEFSVQRGTAIVTDYDDKSFTFTVLDDNCILQKSGPNFVLAPNNKLIAYQGVLKRETFAANAIDSGAVYEISNENIDISTLRVRVWDTLTGDSNQTFIRYQDISNIDSTSPIYFINENSRGRYELTFGNGIFGKKLNAGNFIEIDYLVTDGSLGNGINTPFSFLTSPRSDLTISNGRITASTKSAGGGDKETVETLKTNAITGFTTQNRAVTADDYRNLLISKFSYIKSVSVWGGEDNIPPAYGKVFISASKHTANTQDDPRLRDEEKKELIGFLKSKKVLSIIPEIVDSEYCNIVLDIFVKYNPNISRLNAADIQAQIGNLVQTYNSTTLNEFDSIFRHSQFVRAVDTSTPAILNSLVRVYLSKSFTIDSSSINNFKLNFGARCAADDSRALITISSDIPWLVNGESYYFADEPTTTANVYRIYTYVIRSGEAVRVRDVGTFNLETGVLDLFNLFSDNNVTFTFTVNSYSNDIVSKRNTLLRIDVENTRINAFADEIARGGNSRTVEYTTFAKER